jgi:hypothetical protein
MRLVLACICALMIGSAVDSAQAISAHTGRWCVINGHDNTRHCYFRRLQDCQKAIADGSGLCVPNEKRRGEMPEDKSK